MLDFIKSRRSTRKFKPDMVPAELLEKVLEAGRYAPSGGNCQSTHFIVILMANALDLGSVWINQLKWLNENEVLIEALQKLGMEENERVYGALALGYADTEDGLPIRTPLARTGNKVTVID